jgi:glutathione S-transferase
MITLYSFGPVAGLPDLSPFVTKVQVLLKMAGLDYQTDRRGFRRAPKGKLPYIDDGGTIVADSTFIRLYLEKKYAIDFDKGLSDPERATAWAFEKLCEDHLYWAAVHARWLDDANFNAGPGRLFKSVPALIRPLIIKKVRGEVAKRLVGQGMGRHTGEEIATLAARDLAALADFLGDKPYFMGDQPSGVDATIFAFVAGSLCTAFTTPLRTAAESHANLRAYHDRLMRRYFPDFA